MQVNDIIDEMVFEEDNNNTKLNQLIQQELNASPNSQNINQNGMNSHNPTILPVMPSNNSSRSKFSSWNNLNNELDETEQTKKSPSKQESFKITNQAFKNEKDPTSDFMDEVDELLLEQELLSPTAASQTLKSISARSKQINSKNKENKQTTSDLNLSDRFGNNTKISKDNILKLESLRDSTLEKLLNGEKDLVDLGLGDLSLSQDDRQHLKKKLGNQKNINKQNQNGQKKASGDGIEQIDDFIMQDISDDLNQLLENYDVDMLMGLQKENQETNQQNKINKIEHEEWNGTAQQSKGNKQNNNKNNKQQPVQKNTNSKFSSVPINNLNSTKPPIGTKNKNKGGNFDQDFNEIESLVEEELSRNANNSNQIDNKSEEDYNIEESLSQIQISQQKPPSLLQSSTQKLKPAVPIQNKGLNNQKKGNAEKRVGSVGSTPKNQISQQKNDNSKVSIQSKSIIDKSVGINSQNRSSSSRGSIGSNQGIGGINQNAINVLNQVKSKGIASSSFPFPSLSGPQRITTHDANQTNVSFNSQNIDGQDSLNSSTGSQGTESSQMYKDLFSVIKTKPKGIAGIRDVQITSQEGIISDEDMSSENIQSAEIQAFPKLVSQNKASELQILAQINNNQDINATNIEVERLLNKNRSKKDLKNKFKSSSAIYNKGKKENDKDDEKEESSPDQEGNLDAEKSISEIIKRHIQNEEALNNKKLSAKNGSYPIPDNIAQLNNGNTKLGLENLKKYVQNQQNKDKQDLDTDLDSKQIDEKEIDEIIKQYQQQDQELQNEAKQKKFQDDQEINQMIAQQDLTQKNKKQKKNIKIVQNKQVQKKGVLKKEDNKNMEKEDDNSDDEDDDMDDDENDIEDETEKLATKNKKTTGSATDDDPDGYEYLDDSLNLNVKSPKQTLIEHMRLLADIFNSSLDEASEYYDQIFDERAQFMLDFENILKIMTFDETVEYVLPCMQIYSSEQDYLKLKLFQNLEKLFKKLFKAEVFVPKSEIIDIITINIFPLASRMLMLSEEAVQIEGVEALLNLSKQYIPKEQAQNLVMKVVQVIMDRISSTSEHQETEEVKEKAKIAVLIIVQKFSEADVFIKDQCQYFLQNHFEEIQNGMLFKIKKFLLPALISISKHLDYDIFLSKVYNSTFKQFNQDEIWGVRKVCIENISNLVKYLRYDDVSRINECIDFFKRCLNDSNRWVKNQALINFGPFVHQIFLKIEQIPQSDKNRDASIAVLQEKIDQICNIYYDLKLILNGKDPNELENSLMEKLDDYSFMQNKTDDIDKIKYYWAYNMPCALLVNGKSKYWFASLKNIYEILYKDILINLRTSISASFKEIIEILEINKMDKVEDRQFFVTVLNHFLKDSDDISSKVLPTICSLVSKFPDDEKTQLLDNLIRKKIESIKQMKNGRDNLIKMLESLFQMFQPTQLMEANFHEYLFDIIKNERAINYKLRAANVLGSKIIAPLIKGKKYRQQLTSFIDEMRCSKNFRHRQIYIQIALSTYQTETEIFKKHFAKNIAQDMENDKCKCVQIALAKLCNKVSEGYSKSLDKVRQKLISNNDETVLQHMPMSGEPGKVSEQKRRYLAVGYGDNKVEGKAEEEKQMTEEEWLDKEHKEIEEIEKTVTIRFANYSTLMRAQTLTQGLSAQLAMFLSTMGTNNVGAGNSSIAATSLLQKQAIKESAIKNQVLLNDEEETNKRLTDKAGYSRKLAESDSSEKQKEAKLRSLSPLGLLTASEFDKPNDTKNGEEEDENINKKDQVTQKQEDDNNSNDTKIQQKIIKNSDKQLLVKDKIKDGKK